MSTAREKWPIGSGARVWSKCLEITFDLPTRAVLTYGCLFIALSEDVQYIQVRISYAGMLTLMRLTLH
jgi:hypothetical protein